MFLEGIVRTGSVTAATVELAMTHSAFSRQLFQLQAWLGILPFEENRRGMISTADVGRLAEVLGGALTGFTMRWK
ncbi:MAG: LysR family transcriptional regulator [Hyphomicrobium sp.]